MWPWAKEHAIRGEKKGGLKGVWWKWVTCQRWLVTTCQVHLPSSPTIGNKTEESSASEVRLGALLPLLFCKYLLFKALSNSKVIACYTSLRAFFPWIPARSQPAWWPCPAGGGVAHASPWQQSCHSTGDSTEQPSLLLLTLVPALGRCKSSACDTGNICCYKTSHFCPLEPWFRE